MGIVTADISATLPSTRTQASARAVPPGARAATPAMPRAASRPSTSDAGIIQVTGVRNEPRIGRKRSSASITGRWPPSEASNAKSVNAMRARAVRRPLVAGQANAPAIASTTTTTPTWLGKSVARNPPW